MYLPTYVRTIYNVSKINVKITQKIIQRYCESLPKVLSIIDLNKYTLESNKIKL